MPRSRSRSPARRPDSSTSQKGSYSRDDKSSDRRHPAREPERGYERKSGSSRHSPRREERRERDRDDHQRRRRSSRSRSPRRSERDRRDRDHISRPLSPSASRSPEPPKPKLEPNFKNSGLLAAATNTVKHADGTSTVLKYNEPPEARKPSNGWRLYVFKGKEQVELLHLSRQSAFLVGRDRGVADIATEHPSCSKQHAAFQFRQVTERNEYGDSKTLVKPFVIDLESTNGTHVNDEEIPASRYYELKVGDVIRFGQSTREYVLLNEDGL